MKRKLKSVKTLILSTKVRQVYFLDIPKKNTECTESVISVIEDLKNGHTTTVMYGKMKSLIFNSPHVIIFSNSSCPKQNLSQYRWRTMILDDKSKVTARDHISD